MLKNLLDTAPRTEPVIRIYKNYMAFNRVAAELMGMKEGDAVSIMQDDRDGYLYVSNNSCTRQSYGLRLQHGIFVVSNAALCRKMAEILEGYGKYRICKEETIEFMEHIYYNIFKKKYGKD